MHKKIASWLLAVALVAVWAVSGCTEKKIERHREIEIDTTTTVQEGVVVD